jgi:hypothetical protein
MRKFLVFKNCLDGKTFCTENCLNSKIDYIKQLLVLKNYLHGKTSYIEIFVYNEKVLAFSTICIEKLFGLKNWLHLKTSLLKICTKHPKNHKNYGIRSLHIYVQYLYTKSNYKKVAQKL